MVDGGDGAPPSAQHPASADGSAHRLISSVVVVRLVLELVGTAAWDRLSSQDRAKMLAAARDHLGEIAEWVHHQPERP